MLWRIDTTDTGGESRAPREHIRNFAAGYDREFVRQVAGIPTGKTVTSAVWRCRRSANADSEIVFEKTVTPTFNLAQGQVADVGAGGVATLQFLLYGVETLELVRRAHIECIVTLSDGVAYPAMTRGTIKGYRSLVSVPSSVPSPAAFLTGSKTTDALADNATDVITFTVTDAQGVALPGIVINVATADPTKVSISASTLVTNGSGQATVTIRKLVALGTGVTVPVTASIASLQYPVAVSDGSGGGSPPPDTTVALVEWVEGNTGSVPSGGTLTRTARVKNAAGAVLAGKTVTFNNPNPAHFTRAPASGTTDAGGLVAVVLTYVAAGGPDNLTAASDGIVSANCAVTAAAGGGSDPLLALLATLGDTGDGAVVPFVFSGRDPARVTTASGHVTAVADYRALSGVPALVNSGVGVTHDVANKALVGDGTSVLWNTGTPFHYGGDQTLVVLGKFVTPTGNGYFVVIGDRGSRFLGVTVGANISGWNGGTVSSGVAASATPRAALVFGNAAMTGGTVQVPNHAAQAAAVTAAPSTDLTPELCLGSAWHDIGGGPGAGISNEFVIYDVFLVNKAGGLSSGDVTAILNYATAEYGIVAAA